MGIIFLAGNQEGETSFQLLVPVSNDHCLSSQVLVREEARRHEQEQMQASSRRSGTLMGQHAGVALTDFSSVRLSNLPL